MAKIVNSDYPALVGYKYEKSVYNDMPGNPLWTRPVVASDKSITQVRIAPKHVSEPIDSILKVIESLS